MEEDWDVQVMKIRHWIRVVDVEGKEFEVECYGVDYRTQESRWPPRNIFIFWHGFGQMGFATPSHLNAARPHLFREIHCQFSQVYPEQVFVSVGVEPVYPMGRKRPFFEDEARAVIQALDLDAGEATLSGETPAVRVVGYSTGGVMAGTLGYLLGAREIFLFGGAGLCDLKHGVPELAWRTHWAVYQIALAVMAGPERLGLLQRVASPKAWQRLYQKTALQALWGLLNRVNPLHPDPRIAFSRLRSTWQDLSACTTFNPFFERLEAPVYVLWPTGDWLFPLARRSRPLPENIYITTCDGHHYVPGAEPELTVRELLHRVEKATRLAQNMDWIREVQVNGNDFRLEAHILDYRESERTWPPDHLTVLCPGFGQERLSFPDHSPNLFSEVCSQFNQVQGEQVFAIVAVDPVHVNNRKHSFFQDEAQVILKGLGLDSEEATGPKGSTRLKVVGYSGGSAMATTLGYLTGADEVFLFNAGGLCEMRFGLAQLVVRFLIESIKVGFDVRDGTQRLSLLRRMLSLAGWRALFRTRRIWQAFFGVLGRALILPWRGDLRISFSRLRSIWQDLANCTHFHPFLTRLSVPVWVLWPTNDGIFCLADLRGVTLPENVVLITYEGHHHTTETESAQIVHYVLERRETSAVRRGVLSSPPTEVESLHQNNGW
jgi:hypothetical protein